LRRTSRCGLGQTAGNPVRDTWLKFRPAYEQRLIRGEFDPAVDLDAALASGLLDDPDIVGADLMADKGPRRGEGVGVIEAPRGTLFHHYRADENDLVTYCNLIVSTTNNNQAMNEAIRAVASRYLSGREITEGLLNHIEVAIRAYDPCLSCATHALGQMPLEIDLIAADGALVSRARKG